MRGRVTLSVAKGLQLLLMVSVAASAQERQPVALQKGERVRVKARGFTQWQQGEIHLIDSASLVLKLAEAKRPLVSFAMSAVDSVQRRQRRGGVLPIAIGATIGALAGVAIGSRVGQSLYYPDADDTVNQGYLMAIPGGAVGALVGGIVGHRKSPKVWVPVALR